MEESSKQGVQRVHKVSIRKGEVIEKAAEFENSVFYLLYRKAEKIILDIVQEEEEKDGSGHLLSFMGERGSGKTTAMLSFLRALKEGEIYKEESSRNQANTHFITFDVIDASMLEEEEDLFEIILAQMLVRFLEEYDQKASYRESWDEGKRDGRKEIQKMFNDLLEGFRSLKGNNRGEELSSLASLKSLSFSSRLRQNFQELVKKYLSYGRETNFDCKYHRSYLVFAIDDLDMNIEKGFEMLAQIHRYMLVPHVIIMVTAKYEQLEILGRKYFSKMVERLDRETEDWKVDYLNRTVKEYLEKMLPSYYRLYLPDFENRATGDNLIIQQGQKVKEAVFGKIFRRIGIYFDGSGDKKHYLMPTSMRGLNDYYLFLSDLVKLQSTIGQAQISENTLPLQRDNLDKFQNDFVYRYAVEHLGMEEREEIHKLLQKSFFQWNQYLYQYVRRFIPKWKWKIENEFGKDDRILLEMFLKDQECFGNILWGIFSCVENGWVTEEWKNCVIVLYSLELSRKVLEKDGLKRKAFGRSVIGLWANQIFPKVAIVPEGTKKERIQFGGSIKGCRTTIDFKWDVNDEPQEDTFFDWLYDYREAVLTMEMISLFFEAFHENSGRIECIRMESKVKRKGNGGAGEQLEAVAKIPNKALDFNIFGFLSNLLEAEKFYDEFHEAFIRSWLKCMKVDEAGKLEVWMSKLRENSELSLYLQIMEWNQEAKGLVLPYQHTDIYTGILVGLKEWSIVNLPERCVISSAWELLREVVIQIENILGEKEAFLQKADENYKGQFLRYFQECPVIKCIKDYRSMGLCENFPEKFESIFGRCCGGNEYVNLYDLEDEIATSENAGTKDITS